jgi:hypothetical protein
LRIYYINDMVAVVVYCSLPLTLLCMQRSLWYQQHQIMTTPPVRLKLKQR